MAETDSKVITKLVQAIYLGQTTVTKKEKIELQNVVDILGMKMPLDSKEDSDTEDSEPEAVKESSAKKGKITDKSNQFSDEDDSPPEKKKSVKTGKKVRLFLLYYRADDFCHYTYGT